MNLKQKESKVAFMMSKLNKRMERDYLKEVVLGKRDGESTDDTKESQDQVEKKLKKSTAPGDTKEEEVSENLEDQDGDEEDGDQEGDEEEGDYSEAGSSDQEGEEFPEFDDEELDAEYEDEPEYDDKYDLNFV